MTEKVMVQVYFILSNKIILLRSHLLIPPGESYLRECGEFSYKANNLLI